MYGLIFLSLENQRMRYWIRKYNSILKSIEAINEAFSGVCFEMAQFDSIFTRAKHIMSTRPEKTVTV